jgi:hypothetical protein
MPKCVPAKGSTRTSPTGASDSSARVLHAKYQTPKSVGLSADYNSYQVPARTYSCATCRMFSCNIQPVFTQPQWTVTIEEGGLGFNPRSITETLTSFQVNSPSHYTCHPLQQRSQQLPANNFSGAYASLANITQLRFIAGCDRKRDNDHHSTQCKSKTVILNKEIFLG